MEEEERDIVGHHVRKGKLESRVKKLLLKGPDFLMVKWEISGTKDLIIFHESSYLYYGHSLELIPKKSNTKQTKQKTQNFSVPLRVLLSTPVQP